MKKNIEKTIEITYPFGIIVPSNRLRLILRNPYYDEF
jgi:hypothetical protein